MRSHSITSISRNRTETTRKPRSFPWVISVGHYVDSAWPSARHLGRMRHIQRGSLAVQWMWLLAAQSQRHAHILPANCS